LLVATKTSEENDVDAL